jgi:uncharacterized protein YabE (DUF348 family)
VHRIALLSTSKALLLTLVAAVVLTVAGTTLGYAALSRSVTLSLDGETTSVRTLGDNVADVLAGEGIDVDSHDIVAPGLGEQVDDGARITVRFGRPLELNVDGTKKTYWVHSTNVDAALAEIGRRYVGADLSASRGASIDRTGMTLSVATPKKLNIKIGANKRTLREVAGLTVQDVLTVLDVEYDKDDIIKPSLDTVLEEGDKITVIRVKVVTKDVSDEVVHFDTVKREDSSMYEGDTKTITAGVNGLRDVSYRLEYRNGELFATKVLSQDVKTEPKDAVVRVGTKQQPTANYASGGTAWDRIAQCESGGNWALNTGNGYYGGLQFSASTWHAYGGSGLPNQNSRAEQIRIAEKVRAASGGYGAWPTCGRLA